MFFNDTATTEIYTLSLHDALPIYQTGERCWEAELHRLKGELLLRWTTPPEEVEACFRQALRSEEHTSELQSLRHLVCRLLLEKKKKNKNEYSNIVQRT